MGELARGSYKPGRASNEHARGFERALEQALRDLSDGGNESLLRELEADDGKEVRFLARFKVSNPVDIDEYIAIIQRP